MLSNPLALLSLTEYGCLCVNGGICGCCASKATYCIVQTLRSLTFTAEPADRSGYWVDRLKGMLPQLLQLPSTKQEVEATLFPAQSTLRIPVLPAFYDWQDSLEAAKFLERADNHSSVVTALTFLLQEPAGLVSSEMNTTQLAGIFVRTVFHHLSRHRLHSVHPTVLLNCTEPPHYTSSRAVQKGLWPDTIVVMNEFTLMIGKDKVADLKLAIKDLQDKRLELNALHYGPVRFTLAYAAAGTRFQLFWISADGKMVSISCPGSKPHVKHSVSCVCNNHACSHCKSPATRSLCCASAHVPAFSLIFSLQLLPGGLDLLCSFANFDITGLIALSRPYAADAGARVGRRLGSGQCAGPHDVCAGPHAHILPARCHGQKCASSPWASTRVQHDHQRSQGP